MYWTACQCHILHILANKKKAEMQKTGGGPPGPELTPAEELALANNRGRPIMQGIAGGSSSGEVAAGVNPYVQGRCTSFYEFPS